MSLRKCKCSPYFTKQNVKGKERHFHLKLKADLILLQKVFSHENKAPSSRQNIISKPIPLYAYFLHRILVGGDGKDR